MKSCLPAPPQRLFTKRLPRIASWRLSGLVLFAAAGLLIAGCSSTPPVVRFHSLLGANAAAGAATAGDAAGRGSPISLVVAPVGIPPAVDQPQWLVRRADDTLQMLEQDRWAAPLADEFRSALRALLSSRWGIVDGSLPRSVDGPAKPSWRLVVEVQRMDARPGVDTLIDVRWTLLPPQATAASAINCSAHIVEAVRAAGTVPIADAYRQSVVRLADQIGAWLRAASASAVGVGADCGPVKSATI